MTNEQWLMDTDPDSWAVRISQRNTPAGKLLSEIGMDYYDTESCARRVAEYAARKLAAHDDMLAALLACVEPSEPGEDCPLPAGIYNMVCEAIAKATGATHG